RFDPRSGKKVLNCSIIRRRTTSVCIGKTYTGTRSWRNRNYRGFLGSSPRNRRVAPSVKHYNFDATISLGYLVNSRRAIQFRQWVTRTLREHLTCDWTLNRQNFEADARELQLMNDVAPGKWS